MNWTPPRDEGIRHDALVDEALLSMTPDDHDHTDPGVYALLLSTPDTNDVEAHARLWREQHDARPAYLETIADSERVVYVGAAKSVRDRIADHAAGKQSSAVCDVFPVHSVWGVWWCGSAGEAFDRERARALDLNNQFPSVYFHSR